MAAAYVQSKSDRSFPGSTQSVTFTSNVGAGGLIAVYIKWGDTSVTLNSVDDTLGNTYTLVGSALTGGNSRTQWAYAKNISGGACTVTAHYSGTPAQSSSVLTVTEVSGADTTSPLDGNDLREQDNVGTSTDAVTSNSITTTADGDLILGVCYETGEAATMTAGTGYTARITNTPSGHMTEDKTQTTHGSVAATFTTNSAFLNYYVGVLAIKAASGGGGGVTYPELERLTRGVGRGLVTGVAHAAVPLARAA